MELPATLDIDAERKAALKRAIKDGVKGLSFDDTFYFTLGCRFALTELSEGDCTPDRLLDRNGPMFRKGRDLVFFFGFTPHRSAV